MTRRSQPPYPPELRERAVRMVAEVIGDYDSPRAAMNAVAETATSTRPARHARSQDGDRAHDRDGHRGGAVAAGDAAGRARRPGPGRDRLGKRGWRRPINARARAAGTAQQARPATCSGKRQAVLLVGLPHRRVRERLGPGRYVATTSSGPRRGGFGRLHRKSAVPLNGCGTADRIGSPRSRAMGTSLATN